MNPGWEGKGKIWGCKYLWGSHFEYTKIFFSSWWRCLEAGEEKMRWKWSGVTTTGWGNLLLLHIRHGQVHIRKERFYKRNALQKCMSSILQTDFGWPTQRKCDLIKRSESDVENTDLAIHSVIVCNFFLYLISSYKYFNMTVQQKVVLTWGFQFLKAICILFKNISTTHLGSWPTLTCNSSGCKWTMFQDKADSNIVGLQYGDSLISGFEQLSQNFKKIIWTFCTTSLPCKDLVSYITLHLMMEQRIIPTVFNTGTVYMT